MPNAFIRIIRAPGVLGIIISRQSLGGRSAVMARVSVLAILANFDVVLGCFPIFFKDADDRVFVILQNIAADMISRKDTRNEE